jgi:hypothetical protein
VRSASLINNGGFGFCMETIRSYAVGTGGRKRKLVGNDNTKYMSDVHVSWIFLTKGDLSFLKSFRTVRSKSVAAWIYN